MRKIDEIHDAELFYNDVLLVVLDNPKLSIKKGIISIECFLNKELLSFSNNKFNLREFPNIILHNNVFKIKAKTSKNSIIEFLEVLITQTSYPTFQFVFTCYSHSIEYTNVEVNGLINNSVLNSFNIEGWKLQYNKTSNTIRNRNIFGKEDATNLIMEFDNMQIPLNLWFKKRYCDLQVALVKHPQKSGTVIVKFYGNFKIAYRIYNQIKFSIQFFLSYLAGNNIIIREECFSNNRYGYFVKTFSEIKNKKITTNEYLPVNEIVFRHKDIVEDYFETISVFLLLDKKIKISEIIYLINQSKKVDFESAFFILLICIEKLSRLLLKSDFVSESEKVIISQNDFDDIKEDLFKSLLSMLPKTISDKEKNAFKQKVYNLNYKGKTDYKIDQLLTYCEIERTDKVNSLFPQLRNLAIHQGEISNTNQGHYENYISLFNLVNEIICNLIQYKGIRRPLTRPPIRELHKKENFLWDYKSKVGYVNGL